MIFISIISENEELIKYFSSTGVFYPFLLPVLGHSSPGNVDSLRIQGLGDEPVA